MCPLNHMMQARKVLAGSVAEKVSLRGPFSKGQCWSGCRGNGEEADRVVSPGAASSSAPWSPEQGFPRHTQHLKSIYK